MNIRYRAEAIAEDDGTLLGEKRAGRVVGDAVRQRAAETQSLSRLGEVDVEDDAAVEDGADEEVVRVLPAELAGLHEVGVGRGDGRFPGELRILVMRGGAERDKLARRAAIAAHRAGDVFPAAVEAGGDAVDLIILVGAVLGVPEISAHWVEGHAKTVANAVGVDVIQRPARAGVERIGGDAGAVGIDPQDAGRRGKGVAVFEIFGALIAIEIAGDGVELVVWTEGDLAGVVIRSRRRGADEDFAVED